MNIVDELLKRDTLPKVKDLVVCKIKKFSPYGAFAESLEHKNVDIFIPLPEISRKRIKKITDRINIGDIEVVEILDVKESGIDGSLRRVSKDEKRKKLNEWKLEKRLISYIYYSLLGKLNENQIVNLIEKIKKEFELVQYFVAEYKDNKKILENILKDKKAIKLLQKIIDEYLSSFKVEIRGKITISCEKKGGVTIIKETLKKFIERMKNKGIKEIELKYISSPEWYFSFKVSEFKAGKKIIDEVLRELEKEVKKKDIQFKLEIEKD